MKGVKLWWQMKGSLGSAYCGVICVGRTQKEDTVLVSIHHQFFNCCSVFFTLRRGSSEE